VLGHSDGGAAGQQSGEREQLRKTPNQSVLILSHVPSP
jgi:hypothetical protein